MRADIIVVDDESGPRESLRMILNLEHDVRLASSGPEALALVAERKPDLVFLDIRMPEMDGIEVLRRIKETAPDVEVAMITAYAAVQSAQRAMRLGALDYITKPFGVSEVEAVVERALARRREQHEERLLFEQLDRAIDQISGQLAAARRDADEGHELAKGLTSAHSSLQDQINEVLRLNSIGEVAAEVAHDLNNFLSTILFRIEIMLLDLDHTQGVDVQTLSEGLEQIALAARDGGEALERLSALSSTDPYAPTEKVDLNAVLQAAEGLSRGRVDRHETCEVSFDLGELPEIDGSSAGLRAVFTNLIINAHHAVQARPGAHEVRVRSYRDGDYVIAQVLDDGVGMTPEVRARLFEPFFTTKGEGGTGLGLAVAHKAVAQHHGTITFDSAPGAGTTVTVRLPISQRAPTPEPNEEADGAVLVVDDQEGMLVVTREVLQAEGLTVLTAASGEEAVALFEEAMADPNRPTPGVVVTDLRMPGIWGGEVGRRIKELAPDTRVVLLSAYLDDAPPEALEVADLALEKPCDLGELSRMVRGLMDTRA